MSIVSAMEKDFIDLYTLQLQMRAGVEDIFPERVWVRAEVSSVSVKSNGHCYLELSQDEGGTTVAKAKAVIWRSRYMLLSRYFREATGEDIKAGMTILARVQVTYSELYGLTLSIDDIDADVTVGERERERQATMARLREDGSMELQAALELPVLPYRLAVISAKDAAGFGDFCHHLLDNQYGFVFDVELFEATMQGASAPESISDALDAVQTAPEPFDAVLLMRGGGSFLDLSCFDDYGLCFAIAHCPVPVFTAIGHDRDFHVADMVAHTFVKTPTALADVFLDCYLAEDERIASYSTRLRLAFRSRISQMESRVELLRSRILSADPRSILKRGYTLVSGPDGKVMKSASMAGIGDRIGVMFGDGTLECEVKEKR